MVARTEASARSEGANPAAARTETPKGAPENAWLEDLGVIATEVRRLLDVQFDRARVRARRRLWGAALAAPLLLAGATMAVLAGWFVVVGLANALRDDAGLSNGLAQLSAGLSVVALLGLATAAWVRRSERRLMRDLETKYADPEPSE